MRQELLPAYSIRYSIGKSAESECE